MTLDSFPFYNIMDNNELLNVMCGDVPNQKGNNPVVDCLSDTDLNLIENFDSVFEGHADIDPDINYPLRTFKSTYVLHDNLNLLFDSSTANNFNILAFNIRSIAKNFDHFVEAFHLFFSSLSVIILSETWLTEHNTDLYNLENYSVVHKYRKNKKGGGVSIYTRASLYPEIVDKYSEINKDYEFICIKIKKKYVGTPHDVYIVGCYRPPSGDNIKFIDRLNITIQELEPDRSIIVLGGDINLDLLKHANVRNISYYLDLLLSYNLFPSITKATRFSTQSRSLLDHIFTNYSQTNSKSHIIVTDISDHFPVLLMNEITVPQRKDTIEKIRLFTHLNIVNFNKDIRNSDWDVVLNIMETQKAYTKFHSIIQSCFERNFPERQYRSSYRTKLPWITDELGKKISLKNKLFYIYKKRPTQVNQETYKKYKREINKLIRKARREYYNKKIGSNRTNLKTQWKYIKEIMGNTTKNDYPESFDYEGNTLTHPSDICNGFNEFFVNIGLNLANKIPASGNVFEQYLNQPNPKSIFLNPTTEMETLRIFSDLRVSAPGWDNISLTLIKPIVNYILPQLVHIFNLSFQQGVVPSETKIARVKPLYKSDNPNLFCNYRPISILPIFSKVFEKLIHKRLITFFTENDIIYDHQFGFRERHSTSLALTFLNHRISSSFENNQITLGIFLDFSKAFDTVNF